MPFNIPILLIPLLGGFVFVTYFNRTKWYAVRAEKDRLILYASIAGLVHLVAAWAITSLATYLPCASPFWCFSNSLQRWKAWWDLIRPFPYAGTAVLSFLLASVSWWPLNLYVFDKDKEADRIIVQEGGPLEQLLDAAMQTKKHVLVTLKTDKTYIGFVDSSFTPGQMSRTIRIWPTQSGYRRRDKRVVPIVDYTKVYRDIEEDFRKQGRSEEEYLDLIQDFRVVFSLDDISSISLYWEEVGARYFIPDSEEKTELRQKPLPFFETTPLPPSKKPDPILNFLDGTGDLFLRPMLGDESKSDTARDWRIVWGFGVIVLLAIAFFYFISN